MFVGGVIFGSLFKEFDAHQQSTIFKEADGLFYNRSTWNKRAGLLPNTHHGEKTVQKTTTKMYQNTVNQAHTERSHAQSLLWDSIPQVEAVLREKCTSSATNFSKNLYFPDLLSSSVRFAKCDATRQGSGGFYGPNAQQSADPTLINEKFVDLDQYLLIDASSDERPAAATVDSTEATIRNREKTIVAQTANDLDHHLYNNTTSNYTRYANPSTDPLISINNLKDTDRNGNNNTKNIDANDEYMAIDTSIDNNSTVRSGYTSECASPINVLSMEGSPCGEHFSNDPEVDDYLLNEGFLASLDSIMRTDEKLSLVYTPENSNGLPFNGEFPGLKINYNINSNNINNNNNDEISKRNNVPPLTLNFKDILYNKDDISTPNIIDSIIANEQQMPSYTNTEDEGVKETLFFTNIKLEELTPCPSTSPPAIVSDNTDSFLTTDSPPAITPKKRGRPRKRRLDSENSVNDDGDDLNDVTYVPRSSQTIRRKPRTPRAVASKQLIYEDVSDDDDEYKPPVKFAHIAGDNRLPTLYEVPSDEAVRAGKRGRPPKHARSISSDDYSCLDPDEARYREMRDRNNEASRKSRYKRKQKEEQLSGEREDLELENIRLKAQVEELQQTVERYRENLMKVMLSKK
ncbi:hypothetical protein Trydic_g6605 [Trypoxylus dichotomus]